MSLRRSPLPGIPAATLVIALSWSAGTVPLSAQDSPHAPDLLPEQHPPRRAYPTIATIRIERQDVFDPDNPDERHPHYVPADTLPIETREEVVRRERLFYGGHSADP